jgi:hypothetical protein
MVPLLTRAEHGVDAKRSHIRSSVSDSMVRAVLSHSLPPSGRCRLCDITNRCLGCRSPSWPDNVTYYVGLEHSVREVDFAIKI